MFPVFCVVAKASGLLERGRPARTMPRHSLGHYSDRPGTAPWVSRFGSLRFTPTGAAKLLLTLSDLHKQQHAGGTPALPGGSPLLMGWGDGRVGAGDRYFFMNIDVLGMHRIFSGKRVRSLDWVNPAKRPPHRLPYRAASAATTSCLSPCASMLMIWLTSEAAPSRLRGGSDLLLTERRVCPPRLPGSALSPTPPQGGVILERPGDEPSFLPDSLA